jgi:inorganic pyrophosphatase
MTSARNRSIGFQIYKYGIVGFLQWGYNFYANWHSVNPINPYLVQDGDGWVSPGDAFSVYPDSNGEALESLRIIVFHEALQDLRAMKLCAELYGKDFVVAEIEKICGEVAFDRCPTDAKTVLAVRERVNELIALQVGRKALKKKYLGKKVKIKIDRPVGYVHKKGEKVLTYPINYGYIEGVLGGDGEELDVYLLGTDKPAEEAECRIIAIVRRENDVEDKLVGAPEGMSFTAEEIANAVAFQEKYYVSRIETV